MHIDRCHNKSGSNMYLTIRHLSSSSTLVGSPNSHFEPLSNVSTLCDFNKGFPADRVCMHKV